MIAYRYHPARARQLAAGFLRLAAETLNIDYYLEMSEEELSYDGATCSDLIPFKILALLKSQKLI